MYTVLLVIHVLIALGLVGTILLQRSEGGGLGIGGSGGGGGGMGGLLGNRAAASGLTMTTAILAAAFFATSLGLSLLSSRAEAPLSILDAGAPPAAGEAPAPPR